MPAWLAGPTSRAFVRPDSDIVWLADETARVGWVSEGASRVLGYRELDLVGGRGTDLIHPEDRPDGLRTYQRALASPEPTDPVRMRYRAADRTWHSIEVVVHDRLADPEIGGVLVVARDVTEHEALLRGMLAARERHPVSGLPGADAFSARARRGDVLALVCVELVDFDRVEAVLGPATANTILRAVGERVRRAAPRGAVVAHVRDDRLVVGLRVSTTMTALLASRIVAATARPFPGVLGGRDLRLVTRAGVAPVTGAVDESLRQAIVAARHAPPFDWVSFAEPMRASLDDELVSESALHRAVANDGVRTLFQPIVRCEDARPVACEALARVEIDDALRPPAEFLAAARALGILGDIGRSVRADAVRSLDVIPAPVTTHLNATADDLTDADFVPDLVEACVAGGHDPGRLVVEVTELAPLGSPEVVERLRSLQDAGVQTALDDFGTGWATVDILRRAPFDYLKLDGSMVRAAAESARGRRVLTSVVQLAHDLGSTVIAEGVETRAQAEVARAHDCDLAQGFWFGVPVDLRELEEHWA